MRKEYGFPEEVDSVGFNGSLLPEKESLFWEDKSQSDFLNVWLSGYFEFNKWYYTLTKEGHGDRNNIFIMTAV